MSVHAHAYIKKEFISLIDSILKVSENETNALINARRASTDAELDAINQHVQVQLTNLNVKLATVVRYFKMFYSFQTCFAKTLCFVFERTLLAILLDLLRLFSSVCSQPLSWRPI